MGVLLQRLDGLGDVAGVPELHPAVVPAAGQVVLLVGVEIQVPHQLAVCTLNAVDLAVQGRRGVGTGKRWDMGSQRLPPAPSPGPPSSAGSRRGAPVRRPRLRPCRRVAGRQLSTV